MEEQKLVKTHHGGYRRLKSFQISRVVYDVTVAFCNRYVPRNSRTHDQMVQAARSCVQNIAEGSCASGTSSLTELRLTGVARASLEELRLDFEDFLRQRMLPLWPANHPVLVRFKETRCKSLDEFQAWFHRESAATLSTSSYQETIQANGILSMINLARFLLDRQIESLERSRDAILHGERTRFRRTR